MSDGVSLPPSTGKAAAREVTYSGETMQAQAVGIMAFSGSDDAKTAVDITGDSANGLDVDATRVQTQLFSQGFYTPSTKLSSTPGLAVDTPLYCDDNGAQVVRGQVLTDEGSWRDDFPGSSLTTALGANPTFVLGSPTVTIASGFLANVRPGQYIKRDSDVEGAWTQIASVDSDTSLTLAANYPGTSGSSASSVSNFTTATTGSGMSITVGSGKKNVATGTTSGDAKYIVRQADTVPLIGGFLGVSITQRIANQSMGFGFRDSIALPFHRAEVVFDGTTNTTFKFLTGGNDNTANGQQTTTVTYANAGTSATVHDYRIEVMRDRVALLVDGEVVAIHQSHIPEPYAVLLQFFGGTNTGTAGSTTTLTCDASTMANDNFLSISNIAQGTPVVAGMRAVAHGVAPIAVGPGAIAVPAANRHGIPYFVGGHPNTQTVRLQFTAAQTDTAVITVSSGQKIVVTSFMFTLDNASTVFPLVRLGFGTANTPTTTGVIGAHGGLPAGGGFGRGDGSGIIGIGADNEDLRVTTVGAATGNGVELVVTYHIIES